MHPPRRNLTPFFSYHRHSIKSPPPPPSGNGRKGNNISVFVFVFSIIIFAFFMYNEDVKSMAEFPFSWPYQEIPQNPPLSITDENSFSHSSHVQPSAALHRHSDPLEEPIKEEENNEKPYKEEENDEEERKEESGVGGCDLFTGKWVFDNVSHPLYKEEECKFLTSQVTCIKNGRKDSVYQQWRWKPRGCRLPKFDGKVMLERMRGKRMMFVGDSLNRNQWESMICMVQSGGVAGRRSLEKKGSLSVFTMHDYNATVEFYWAPFLVESNSDDPNIHTIVDRIILPDSISSHAAQWKNVDFLVFNTYIWWMNTHNMKVLRGSFSDAEIKYDELERRKAYKKVISTWANWVDNNLDPHKTMVFFMSMSPLHIKSLDWNDPSGIKCAKETTPILNTTMALDVGTDHRLIRIVGDIASSMKMKVHFLNITTLSEYRKDAHTSVYTIRQGKMLTTEQQADPNTFADCIHWCLPGLPDIWNEFIYTYIISATR